MESVAVDPIPEDPVRQAPVAEEAPAPLIPVDGDIPVLEWTERSDWINVMTDVRPGARGDGVADDTAAIQAALNLVNDLSSVTAPRTVYLPPGTYKISRQLNFTQTKQHEGAGATIIGHGRSTVLRWYGAAGGNMLWQAGIWGVQFDGITFDGRSTAATGIFADSDPAHNVFQSAGRYENLAFRGFTGTALYFPNNNNCAAADGLIKNCQFVRCDVGICTKLANVWTWSIEGCEFLDCRRGYRAWFGQAYVRACHFERSTEADVTAEGPGPVTSVNRCTSVGSKRFFWNASDIYIDGGDQSIRDCQVAGWTATDGAIRVFGSQTISDCVFTDPPNGNPPICVVDGRNTDNSIVVGSNSPSTIFNGCRNLRVDTIPAGRRSRNLTSPHTRFLKRTARAPGMVFDAKTQFGAAADGTTDDTAAVQRCLDAAKGAGKNAVAYFPAGHYRITGSVAVTGGDYRVEGSTASKFVWGGGSSPCMFNVDDPQGISFRWLSFRVDRDVKYGVVHSSSSGSSFATYEHIDVGDSDRGLLFSNMAAGSKALVEFVWGSVRVGGSSRAHLLFNYAGSTLQALPFRVEGTSRRDGFLGALTVEGAIEVRDNQNLVVENQYCEAVDRFLQIWGGGSTPGYVTIGGDGPYWTHWSTWNSSIADPARREMMTVDNYNGRVYRGNSLTENRNPRGSPTIRHTGGNPLDLIFLADEVRVGTTANRDWDWQVGPRCRRILVGRKVNIDWVNSNIPNAIPKGGLESVAAAWDDLRLLGRYDLELNYPNRTTR